MSYKQSGIEVLKEVDIHFVVVGRRIKHGLFGENYIISCYSKELDDGGFRLGSGKNGIVFSENEVI